MSDVASYPLPTRWLDFWLLALGEPLGLRVRVTDKKQFLNLMYLARLNAPLDQRLAIQHLQLRSCPTDPHGEVWVVNPGSPSDD